MTLIWLKDRNFVLEVTLYHGVLLRGIPWYDCLACILLSLVSRVFDTAILTSLYIR